jgi:hypothetical protein
MAQALAFSLTPMPGAGTTKDEKWGGGCNSR